MFERVVIIGGGASIQEGVDKGLWDVLKNEVTIGLNYAIRHFKDPTAVSFVDLSFYNMNVMELNTYPLVITRQHYHIAGNNYIKLFATGNEYYGFSSLEKTLADNPHKQGQKIMREKGVYSMKLAGLFSTTYCMCLGFKEIYLLGFDFGEPTDKAGTGQTHFYQKEFLHRGVGKRKVNGKEIYNTLIYENSPGKYFDCYKSDLEKVKIFNVSPNSRIDTFEKINYDSFFQKLRDNPVKIDQNKARESIRKAFETGTEVVIENISEKKEVFMTPTTQPIGKTIKNEPHMGIIVD